MARSIWLPYQTPSPSIFGLAAVPPLIDFAVRQASASGSATGLSQFSSTPERGSVIVAAVISNSSNTTGTISGFGVQTWSLATGTAATGASNTALVSWVGVVGDTPSRSATILGAGGASSSLSMYIELSMQNMRGQMLRVVSATSSSATTITASGLFDHRPSWLVGITGSLTDATTFPATWASFVDTTANSRFGSIHAIRVPYTSQATLSHSVTFGAGTQRNNLHALLVR